MRVICQNKHSELVHSGHYFRYSSRFRCSKCGLRVRLHKESREQMKSRWLAIHLSEGANGS